MDFDGNYTLTAYSSDLGGVSSSIINFEVYRGDYNKGGLVFSGIMILLIFGISSTLGVVSIKVDKEHLAIKLFLQGIGLIFLLISIQLSLIVLKEYIKVPAIFEHFSIFYMIFTWFMFIIILFTILIYLWKFVEWLIKKGKIKIRRRN